MVPLLIHQNLTYLLTMNEYIVSYHPFQLKGKEIMLLVNEIVEISGNPQVMTKVKNEPTNIQNYNNYLILQIHQAYLHKDSLKILLEYSQTHNHQYFCLNPIQLEFHSPLKSKIYKLVKKTQNKTLQKVGARFVVQNHLVELYQLSPYSYRSQ